jgi:hypothetical protein
MMMTGSSHPHHLWDEVTGAIQARGAQKQLWRCRVPGTGALSLEKATLQGLQMQAITCAQHWLLCRMKKLSASSWCRLCKHTTTRHVCSASLQSQKRNVCILVGVSSFPVSSDNVYS